MCFSNAANREFAFLSIPRNPKFFIFFLCSSQPLLSFSVCEPVPSPPSLSHSHAHIQPFSVSQAKDSEHPPNFYFFIFSVCEPSAFTSLSLTLTHTFTCLLSFSVSQANNNATTLPFPFPFLPFPCLFVFCLCLFPFSFCLHSSLNLKRSIASKWSSSNPSCRSDTAPLRREKTRSAAAEVGAMAKIFFAAALQAGNLVPFFLHQSKTSNPYSHPVAAAL